MDSGRQFRVFDGMHDFALKVGEPGLARLQLANDGEGFLEVHVGGMRCMAEGVENECVHTMHRLHGCLTDGFSIRNVRTEFLAAAGEEIADGDDFAVLNRQRYDGGFTEVKRTVDGLRKGLQVATVVVFTIEGILEHPFQHSEAFWGAIDRHELVYIDGESPQIVEAGEMIHVRMREDRRVEMADVFTQALRSKIRPCIHYPGKFGCLDVDRAAQSFVPRVTASTNCAITANHGDADGGAGAEKRELHGRHAA